MQVQRQNEKLLLLECFGIRTVCNKLMIPFPENKQSKEKELYYAASLRSRD